MPKNLDELGLKSIADNYDIFFIDIWGVIHNGINLYQDSVEALNQIEKLEAEIDEMNDALEPLNSFVLPGGCKSATFLHLARTICRRAERSVVSLRSKEEINDNALVYLNRLSDWLFVASRVENQENSTEVLWSPGKNK